MHRVFSVARKPAFWLALALFIALLLVWAWIFRSTTTPPPQFVVHTGAAYVQDEFAMRPTGTWVTLASLSDNGGQVTLDIQQGDFRFPEVRFESWNTGTGTNDTPGHWEDKDFQELFSRPLYADSGMEDLLSQPGGRELLKDEAAWAALRDRFATKKMQAIEDLRKNLRPVDDEETPRVFPRSLYFNPDGECLAYVSRNGWPAHLVAEPLGEGTTIEDLKTGQVLTMLPGVADRIVIAPGKQTAVSLNHPPERDGEQARLILWDLSTSERRAELLLPDPMFPFRCSFTADGRYIFARFATVQPLMSHLRWWDAKTGRPVGQIVEESEFVLIDGDRVLVTKADSTSRRTGGVSESYLLHFWDVSTGEKVGEWDLGAPADRGGYIDELTGSDNPRYLAGAFNPEYGRGRGLAQRVLRRLARALGDTSVPETTQVILWDVVDRREVARVPGRSARLSPNGRWLATIDKDGIVRVWEVPTPAPWGSILLWAAAAAVPCWLAVLLLARLAWRWGPTLARSLGGWAYWLWSDRYRRLCAAAIVGTVTVTLVALWWYTATVSQARADMLAAYDEIWCRMNDGMTEADVTALVGRPPDEGPVAEMTVRKMGGGRGDGPRTLRKWTRFGTEMDVYIDEDGKVGAAYISNPLEPLDQLAIWLSL